jgi:hypothetical protein
MAQPAIAIANAATRNWPLSAAITKKAAAAMAATPLASPSMLSSRLNALVMPVIHRIVTATFAHAHGRKPALMPSAATAVAAAICSPSRSHGFRPPRRSSARPTRLSVTAKPSTTASCTAAPVGARTAAATSIAAEKATTIATPPR